MKDKDNESYLPIN